PIADELLASSKPDIPPSAWGRLANSLFRLGTPQNPTRLINIANHPEIPLSTRREALRLLKNWTKPHPADQYLGRHNPLRPRPVSEIKRQLEDGLAPLFSQQGPLVADAIELIAHYDLTPGQLPPEHFAKLAARPDLSPAARIRSLELLATKPAFNLSPLLSQILQDPSNPPQLLLTALNLIHARDPESSFPAIQNALASETIPLRQAAARLLANHPDPRATTKLINLLQNFTTNSQPPRDIQLEILTAAHNHAHPEVQATLTAYQNSLNPNNPLAPFTSSLHGGDTEVGRQLFYSHPGGQCSRCHQANPNSSSENMAGPHLSDIGKTLDRRTLLESLLLPSASISPGYAPVTTTLKSGQTLSGTLLEHTESHLDLILNDQPTRIPIADIDSILAPVSPMPSMQLLLNPGELRDLVAYLHTLRTPPKNKKPLAPNPKPFHPSATQPTPTMAEEPSTTPPAADGLPEGIDPAVFELGKKQYITCSACHGPNGEGVANLGPPLANSEWVTGPIDNLARIQLRGLQGPITVNGIEYNPAAPMAALAYQTDEQIAAVLTFVRNSWGNSASQVEPADIAKWRDEVGQPMLTVADLIPPIKPEPAGAPVALKKAVTDNFPKAEAAFNFPSPFFSLLFLGVIAFGCARFILSKKS
ncbi:MAG: c-type cytochrome, partial [Verrucomicrobiota bacterium]